MIDWTGFWYSVPKVISITIFLDVVFWQKNTKNKAVLTEFGALKRRLLDNHTVKWHFLVFLCNILGCRARVDCDVTYVSFNYPDLSAERITIPT